MMSPATATTIAALFAVGTLWFDLLVLAVVVTITALVENEEGIWATVVFIGTVLSLQYLSKVPILEYMRQNPWQTLGYVGAYFAIGVGWTVLKWIVYSHKQFLRYNTFKHDFMKKNNAQELTPALAASLMDELASNGRYARERVTATAPDPADYKTDLTRWGTYWPFSMVGTALNDVVRKAWDYVYEMLRTTYERIAKAIFRHAAEDVKMAEEYKKTQAAAAGAGSGSSSRRDRGN